MTKAKYAYRSIGEFIKHVTQHNVERNERNPFPEVRRHDLDDDKYLQKKSGRKVKKPKEKKTHVPAVEDAKLHRSPQSDAQVNLIEDEDLSESKQKFEQVGEIIESRICDWNLV